MSKIISASITDDDFSTLSEEAKARNIKMSDLVREKVLGPSLSVEMPDDFAKILFLISDKLAKVDTVQEQQQEMIESILRQVAIIQAIVKKFFPLEGIDGFTLNQTTESAKNSANETINSIKIKY
jgi:hypothetical protein